MKKAPLPAPLKAATRRLPWSLLRTASSWKFRQYGRQIKATVLDTLERLEVTSGRVTVVDKGALDCTLKARVECAVFRACGQSEKNIPWGGAVK